MSREISYPITKHCLVMMNGGFGWIQLRTGNKDAGYIYFESDPNDKKDRFGGPDDHPYIVTHLPMSMWNAVLTTLRSEQGICIRGFDSGDGNVSAFLYTSGDGSFFEGG
ncbi:hypothetical protein [Dyadobacter soli]|nr:hypothetical protein [Dyadobacter soli]